MLVAACLHTHMAICAVYMYAAMPIWHRHCRFLQRLVVVRREGMTIIFFGGAAPWKIFNVAGMAKNTTHTVKRAGGRAPGACMARARCARALLLRGACPCPLRAPALAALQRCFIFALPWHRARAL